MLKRLLVSLALYTVALTVNATDIDKTQPYQMMKQVSVKLSID